MVLEIVLASLIQTRALEADTPGGSPYRPPAAGYACARYTGYAHGMRWYTASPGQGWVLRHETLWPDACWDHTGVLPAPLVGIVSTSYLVTSDGTVLESPTEHGSGWGL